MMKSPSQDQGRAPVIIDYYAAKVIRPGDTWKVFLRAEDPDGDMNDITAVLWQAGVGTYPTEVTRLKGDDRREFSGYLSLLTPNDSNLMSDRMELTILVRDSRGNRSQPIKLPLRFNLGASQEVPKVRVQADKHRLGAIMINIETAHRYSSR
ncbi:MAG: hypothetical protein ACM3MN_03425 [Nitrospirota bacterium]